MKLIRVLAILALVPTLAVAQGYTKADERNGVPAPIIPEDGGDTCAAPTVVGSLPFNDTGDTTGADNTNGTLPAGCSDYTTTAGPDEIYSFTTTNGLGSVSFALTTTDPDYDPSIYLLGVCTSSASCIAGSDMCFAVNNPFNPCGPVSDESFGPVALADGTYYFFVDSFYAIGNGQEAGPYEVDMDGTLPVHLLEFEID